MPRRTAVVEDDDDSVPLDDLLRTGEASRLRRRGAVRATAHRRDDEDAPVFPFPRSLEGGESYLELECGVRSAECSFTPAGPSRPSPLPRSPSVRKSSGVGFIFSSTGCGAIVSARASPAIVAAHHVYTSVDPVGSNTALLHPQYLDLDQRALADALIRDVPVSQSDWEAIGCRVCGNALGFRYAACHPRPGKTSPTYVFFPSAVTPSPDFTFPAIQHPESDDMSTDSPTFSPRVTRYFRSDDEFWPSEMNTLWTPERGFTPTPPRSPPPAATPLAYTTWQAVLPPSTSIQTQTRASRTTDAPRHRESTNTVPVREPAIPHTDWQSFFRRTERPPQNIGEVSHALQLPQPPSDAAALSNDQRDRTSLELPRVPRADTETNPRPLDPPSLHRVSRRPMPPVIRRPTPLDWSSRGRHTSVSDNNSSWAVPASDERLSRRMPPARRMTMPISVPPSPPLHTFTLLDASGERSYPPSVRSSLDVRDMLGVSVEVETDENVVAHGLMQERESESLAERTWNPDPDGENEAIGGDDSEEKEDDLDERRAERTSRNREEIYSHSSQG